MASRPVYSMLESEDARSAVRGRRRWAPFALVFLSGAAAMAAFVWAVDPGLARPRVDVLVLALTLPLVGLVAGGASPAGAVTGAMFAGLALAGLAAGFAAAAGAAVPVLLLPPLAVLASALSALGAWVGQRARAEHGRADGESGGDRREGVRGFAIAAAIIVGCGVSVYAVFVGNALLAFGALGALCCYGASFAAAGAVAGWLGRDGAPVEPVMAAVVIIVLHAALALLVFHALFPLVVVLGAMASAALLALGGARLALTVRRRTA